MEKAEGLARECYGATTVTCRNVDCKLHLNKGLGVSLVVAVSKEISNVPIASSGHRHIAARHHFQEIGMIRR